MTEITKPVEKRAYRQEKRATKSAETRRRIAEAALELHGTLGPAQTTHSMIATRAGVQRHTLYAHFPEERDLFLACSGLFLERDPLPDPLPWREFERPRKKLKAGLGAIYDWYDRNAGILAAVLRDAEYHELTREVVDLRQGPKVIAYHNILGEGLDTRQKALLHLALSFHTWRTLVMESGMSRDDAIAAMTDAIFGKK
jgi:AcrR family transcriptional regulator